MSTSHRRTVLRGLLVLCLALAPAAAFAAKSTENGKQGSSSNSILLGSKKDKTPYQPSVITLPISVVKGSTSDYSGANWLKKIVWTPSKGTPVVLPGRDPKPAGAIPEPGAALLFVFGAGLVALHLRARPRLATAR